MNTTFEDNNQFPFFNKSLTNETLDINNEHVSSEMERKRRIAQIAFLIISCIGIFGNSVSILAMASSKKLRSPTTTFVITLCIADGLFCVHTFINNTMPQWNRNHYFCVLISAAKCFVGTESVFLLVAITINRYVCVHYPKHYSSMYRSKYVAGQIAFTWMCALTFAILPFFGYFGTYGYHPKSGLCVLLQPNSNSGTISFFTTFFALPITVFVICYSRIYWSTCKLSKQLRSLDVSVNAACDRSSNHVDAGEMKILKVMFVISISFVICLLPMGLVKLYDNNANIPALTVLSYLGINLANVINPIIYVLMGAEYRKAYLELFSCKRIQQW
ncbi:G-protein coupled receptor moody-like isoform X3 [Parasteatoda tepidariorum]|uniref:G-protein coupled receptor moody-like isoform X3 n=1 Tax=Parasteatoda tepidariorum TaxID=114398 RepID=UPI00077FC5D6|nr:G-protein coupled receptor moody-like [Parasteatoda tepidariorum]